VNFAFRDLVCADLSAAHCFALRIFAPLVVRAPGQRNPDYSDSRPSAPVQLSPSFSVACFHDEIRPPVIRDRSGAMAPVVS
jgi:hypothetical protein